MPRALAYDPGTGKYTYRQAGTDTEVNPGGSGNATSIQGIPVAVSTPADGNSLTYDADKEELSWASGSGGVPEAPNDGKFYGRKSLGWTEITEPTVLTHAQIMSRVLLGG